ncbi:hypothetical protein VTI28DRAFT_518 [Corynascus sepedonium]
MPTFSCLGRASNLQYLILILPLSLIFLYIGNHYYYAHPFATPISPGYNVAPAPARSSEHDGWTDWWIEFLTRLETTRVDVPRIKFKGSAPGDNWRPDYDHARPDLINLTAEAETKFRESHAAFLKFLPDFARHLPYQAGTRGIVTTAGAPTFGQTISLVLLTRQTGSRLPIQVVLDSSEPWVDFICENEFPRLNATCLYIDEVWANLDPLDTSRFSRFQWKVVSLIVSTFQDVLFLDADCAPVLSPDHIFEKGAEPFTSAGLITWPDYWAPSMSTLFYKIAGDIPVPPLTARTTSESGVMVFDKARHADTLLLAAYYNYNGPGRYYTLLSQHGIGEGDKETFLQAALVLDALREKGVYSDPTEWMKPGAGIKKGYWDVKTMPKSHGRVGKGKKWRGMFMQQMDPMEDYRAVMAAVNKAGAAEGGNTGSTAATATKPASKEMRQRGKLNALFAAPTTSVPTASATTHSTTASTSTQIYSDPSSAIEQPAVPDDYLTNSTFLSTTGNLTISASPARFMFFHHNGVKPDFTRILNPKSGILGVDDGDRPIRMWGDPKWIIERTGRDVEKLWWASSIEMYCRPEMEAWWEGVCAEMRRVFGEVYE